jgi:hypothetical protein
MTRLSSQKHYLHAFKIALPRQNIVLLATEDELIKALIECDSNTN